MPPFRDEAVLVLSIGSEETKVQYGLNETMPPPTVFVPTKVYRKTAKSADGDVEMDEKASNKSIRDRFAATGDEADAVAPLSGGKIADMDALLGFIRQQYYALTGLVEKEDLPALQEKRQKQLEEQQRELERQQQQQEIEGSGVSVPPVAAVPPLPPTVPFAPLLLTIGFGWDDPDLERVVTFLLKEVKVPGLTILPEALAGVYAFAAPTAVVVNIGKDKTEITPVMDFSVLDTCRMVVPYGAQMIDDELARLIPNYTAEQIAELKRSDIYEIVTDQSLPFFSEPSAPATVGAAPADMKDRSDGVDALALAADDDGVIDVAAIVASGKTREFLERREKSKKDGVVEIELRNHEKPRNSFVDSHGQALEVGLERFQGTEKLMDMVAHYVGVVLSKIDDVQRRADCWDNVVLLGGPTGIRGFHDGFVQTLNDKFLITRASTYSEIPSGLNTPGSTPAPPGGLYGQSSASHGQVPTSIKTCKIPDYFTTWKGRTLEHSSFLGSMILAKQVFTPGIAAVDGGFISRDEFLDEGAKAIWNLGFW
ncbi:uncharacterized protein V1510DRAFT_423945 [Dipodascopsis tothii]|uniref:uncharacterized protein n=1 Tax=Dipodascopsis tothii TaxID=44089 RepID=UPI0034CF4450